ncbi:MAG: endonuclease/exonuclease/phosphatase family protein [Nocardioidaceae bacterium]
MVMVGSWNVENLFSDGEFAPSSEAVYRSKITGVAQLIRSAGVDVVGLQEIGDQQAFDDLLAELGSGWTGVLSTAPDTRGIRVAVLSRLPVSASSETVDLAARLAPLQADDSGAVTTRMGRGALQARVELADGPLSLVTCHLKSKLVTYPGGLFQPTDEGQRARYAAYALYRRAAESTTVRGFADTLLDGEGRQRRLMLVGDLNDEPRAATTQILHGPPGSELGTAGALRPDQGDAWRLFNLAPLLPEGQRATRVYRGRGELIDHLLVSRALLESVLTVATVAAGPLPSITEVASARQDEPTSDHAMIVTELALN